MTNAASVIAPQLSGTVLGQRHSTLVNAAELTVPVVFNKHTTYVHSAGLMATAAVRRTSVDLRVAHLGGVVVAATRQDSPYTLAWSYVMDDHEFYVLQLPTGVTLVLDLATNKWFIWGTGTSDQWRARAGVNWLQDSTVSFNMNSNIVVGDDTTGALYFLDPDYAVDDPPLPDFTSPMPFQRVVMGQVPMRGWDAQPCYGVTIAGSLGYVDDAIYTCINLSTSDDQGNTWNDQGSQNMELGQFNQRLYWGSLGSIVTPGRLFRVTDEGGIHRIDGLDMDDADGQ